MTTEQDKWIDEANTLRHRQRDERAAGNGVRTLDECSAPAAGHHRDHDPGAQLRSAVDGAWRSARHRDFAFRGGYQVHAWADQLATSPGIGLVAAYLFRFTEMKI
jgi:hypothetical protein